MFGYLVNSCKNLVFFKFFCKIYVCNKIFLRKHIKVYIKYFFSSKYVFVKRKKNDSMCNDSNVKVNRRIREQGNDCAQYL